MSETSGKKLRVLIVEDESLVAILIEDMLIELGYEIAAVAARVEQAMRYARDLQLDLALLDLNLSGQRTDEVAGVLSERGVPFVFATGYGVAGVTDEWRDVPVLQKPFQIEELERAIKRALRR
jgi:CheY-like chemotaxis protein